MSNEQKNRQKNVFQSNIILNNIDQQLQDNFEPSTHCFNDEQYALFVQTYKDRFEILQICCSVAKNCHICTQISNDYSNLCNQPDEYKYCDSQSIQVFVKDENQCILKLFYSIDSNKFHLQQVYKQNNQSDTYIQNSSYQNQDSFNEQIDQKNSPQISQLGSLDIMNEIQLQLMNQCYNQQQCQTECEDLDIQQEYESEIQFDFLTEWNFKRLELGFTGEMD